MRRELDSRGLRIALIHIDGWLNLPETRFSRENPAEHFYRHAIRFDEMFDQLVLPLRDHRSVRVESDFAEETATRYRRHLYEFTDIDILIVEGIYLLKRQFQSHYDLSFWIDCSFETALERAVARGQEGLAPDLTLTAYQTIYFPAQTIHAARDEPRAAATAVINNDPRLVTTSSRCRDRRRG
jgi:uridine kinase